MANRSRTNLVQFYLSDDEQYILTTKFKVSGMKSMSAFLRKDVLEQAGINLKGLNVDKLKAEYPPIGFCIGKNLSGLLKNKHNLRRATCPPLYSTIRQINISSSTTKILYFIQTTSSIHIIR